MKHQVLAFLHQLSLYDYLLFGGILFFFLLTLFLAILLHHKLKLAVTLIILSFLILIAGPPIGYFTMHHYVYKHTIKLDTVRDLEFTDALVIKGEVINTSTHPIRACSLHISVSKKSPYAILNRFYPYVPFRQKRIDLTGPIEVNQSQNFKVLIEPFRYPNPHTVTVRGVCQ